MSVDDDDDDDDDDAAAAADDGTPVASWLRSVAFREYSSRMR